jgi:metal-responsive CopG/Arc/MetJ family transcriptional regulator
MQRVFVQLPQAMLEQIDQIAGINNRAAFIRDAVTAEIKRRQKEAQIEDRSI